MPAKMPAEHIAKSFDDELAQLNLTLEEMAKLVQSQLQASLLAIEQGDFKSAEKIIIRDKEINSLNDAVDRQAVRLLALRQPMAVDLRLIVSSLRIASELERMGDYAANLAKRLRVIAEGRNAVPKVVDATVALGNLVRLQITMVIHALVQRNADLARESWLHDHIIDEQFSKLSTEIVEMMSNDKGLVVPLTHFLFMIKNLERIGDHSTNIAEAVTFIVTGSRMIEAIKPKVG
ncbi:MAG: phosphate signaling complex protein PhoU [Candidatus Pacebacteria bacterium]|nr:phosphate signaling complex protein PhoU [Candidatus Paceibacterota bacterium]